MSPSRILAAESQLAQLLVAIWAIYHLDGYAVTVKDGVAQTCPIPH